MTGRDPLDYVWWLSSRAAGIVAYLLLSTAVVLGLAMALRLVPVPRRPALRVLHERVALLALGMLAAHGLLLLGDGWLRPGLTGILVPFAGAYRPLWTGIGIVGGYLAAGLSLTYYARHRLGARRWRSAHRLIPVAWALAVVHTLGAGTDAGGLWLQAPLALTVSSVVVLLGARMLGVRAAGSGPVAAPAAPAPAPVPPPAPSPQRPAPRLGSSPRP
jgi:sulfoxide reductase heme-binding subunit YedZ